MTNKPNCCCGSDDLRLMTDYGNGDGRWECSFCDATVYRMDGRVSYASARTMQAAQEAWDDASGDLS